MRWFSKFFKKTGPSQVAPGQRQNRPAIKDYPKDQYKAYWEVLMHHDQTGARQQGTGVVRFYEHGTGKTLSYSTFQDNTHQGLADKIFAYIENHMPSYKR